MSWGGNILPVDLDAGTCAGEPYMTLVNGLSVAPGQRPATRLAEGDKVIVFPPLKGG